MNRRAVIALAVLSVWPFATRAQQRKIPRIGLLWDSPSMFPLAIDALRGGLRDLGWVEGESIIIEYRWTEGRFERLSELAQELVDLDVKLILAPSSIITGAAKRLTSTIPIVFLSHADPLGSGHVASLGKPGGNVTGMSLQMTETNAKGLEILKEIVPKLSSVAVVFDPATPSHAPGLKATVEMGRALNIRVRPVPISAASEFENTFSLISSEGLDAVLVLSTPLFIASAGRMADLAIEHKLPTLFGPKEHTNAGGLLSYSPDRADLWRRGASFVDRILRGASPSDLPVQQPTKFEFVINLKTAKAIGLTIPGSVLARADEVIE
jgi:putative tryptophan/tyrosine transport system substrate-binding protein